MKGARCESYLDEGYNSDRLMFRKKDETKEQYESRLQRMFKYAIEHASEAEKELIASVLALEWD